MSVLDDTAASGGSETAKRKISSHLIGSGVDSYVYATDLPLEFRPVDCKLHDRFAIKHYFSLNINDLDLLSRVDHPNVLGTFEIRRLGENMRSYVKNEGSGPIMISIMPLGECNMREYLRDSTDQESVTLDLLHQILQGVTYLHRGNVLHGDIKPENVIIFVDGNKITAKIADFGNSVCLNSHLSVITIDHSQLYRPPESFTKHPVSLASDIWALGILFVEAIKGSHPYAPLPPKTSMRDQQASIEDRQGSIPRKSKNSIGEHIENVFIDGDWDSGCRFTKLHETLPNLIRDMTRLNPSDRITAESALRNPLWGKPESVDKRKDLIAIATDFTSVFLSLPDQIKDAVPENVIEYEPDVYILGVGLYVRCVQANLLTEETSVDDMVKISNCCFDIAIDLHGGFSLNADGDTTVSIGQALGWRLFSP